jgi:hypothetical protein
VHVAGVAETLADLLAQPARGRPGVELGLDDDAARAGVRASPDPTRCSPPAKRSSVEISALRQQGLVTVSRDSSS